MPADVIEAGVKVAVAPTGKPDTLRFTVPVKPFNAAIVVGMVAVVPGLFGVEGETAEIVKSGPKTRSGTAAVWTLPD